MRIDSHQRFTAEHPPEHFGPVLARNRFGGSVWVAERDDPPAWAEFEFVRAVVALGGAEAWRGHAKFRGIACAGVPDEAPPTGETLDLAVHTRDLPAVAALAARAPDLHIALDHLGGPDIAGEDFASWATGMETLAQFPEVYCKLSGLVRLAPAPWKAADLRPYVQHAIRCFPPSRLMFGSGWPDCLPEYAWKETLAAFTQSLGVAPIEVREEILGGAAARFYRIAEAAEAVL